MALADDSKYFKVIEKPSDKISFEEDLTQLSNCTVAISLTKPKRQGLKNLQEETTLKSEYYLHGIPMAAVTEIKDLSVTDKL